MLIVPFFGTFADLDECTLNTHACTCNGLIGCNALCTNIAGSYTCGCDPEYVLAANGFTCLGELYWSFPIHETSDDSLIWPSQIVVCCCIVVWRDEPFADLDECATAVDNCACGAGLAACTPICTNTDGTFTCSCTAAYQLAVDGVTCNGRLKFGLKCSRYCTQLKPIHIANCKFLLRNKIFSLIQPVDHSVMYARPFNQEKDT